MICIHFVSFIIYSILIKKYKYGRLAETALVTGASEGLGAGIAQVLASKVRDAMLADSMNQAVFRE